MKRKAWLLVALVIGVWSLTAPSEGQEVDPDIFVGPESYIRHHLVKPIKPKYTKAAQDAGLQGKVLLFVWFDGDGNFVEAGPLRPTHDLLLEAVMNALKESRIKPPAPLYPKASYFSEIRFIFSFEDGNAKVSEAPESEQQEVSKEFNQESKKFRQKVERRRRETFGMDPLVETSTANRLDFRR